MTADEMIRAERERQITEEGWTAEHDAGHAEQLADAAWCYRYHGELVKPVGEWWPWDAKYWKPKDRVRNLVRAGALYRAAADAATDSEARGRYQELEASVRDELDKELGR